MIREIAPADLDVGDRLDVNGRAYRVTGRPEVDVLGRVWVDVDLGGLALPVVYDPGADARITTEGVAA